MRFFASFCTWKERFPSKQLGHDATTRPNINCLLRNLWNLSMIFLAISSCIDPPMCSCLFVYFRHTHVSVLGAREHNLWSAVPSSDHILGEGRLVSDSCESDTRSCQSYWRSNHASCTCDTHVSIPRASPKSQIWCHDRTLRLHGEVKCDGKNQSIAPRNVEEMNQPLGHSPSWATG